MSETKRQPECEGIERMDQANGDPLTAAPQTESYEDFERRSGYKRTDKPGEYVKNVPPIGEVFASMQTKFPQPTGSAYSIEEHMFRQDEIQRRHDFERKTTDTAEYGKPVVMPQQPSDQQRSEAVELDTTLSVWSSLAPHPPAEKAIRTIIAQRDATIAELRAEVASWPDRYDAQYRQLNAANMANDNANKRIAAIAALQARVRELESKCVAAGLAVGPFALAVDSPTPTTEK